MNPFQAYLKAQGKENVFAQFAAESLGKPKTLGDFLFQIAGANLVNQKSFKYAAGFRKPHDV